MAGPSQVDQLYKRAEDAFGKRNYDYARDLFKQILTLDPDHVQTRKALRATILKKYQELGGPGKFTLMTKSAGASASIAMNKNKPDKLVEICQNYLIDDPNSSKVRGVLAGALMDLNRFAGASAEAEMALETDAHNIAAAKVLVGCYQKLGKIKEAQEILEKVSRHAPEDRDLERLQRDLAAQATMNKGFEDTKDKGFRAVIKDQAQAADLEKASHLIKSDADIQVQIEKLEAEMGENPTDPKIPKKIGDIYFEIKKDFKTARDWYHKASQLAPQDSVLRDKVDDCMLKTLDVQIESASRASDPKLGELRTNRLRFAIQTFERRVHDRPTDMGLRFELGKYFLQSGPTYMDKAIAEFQQSVKDPKKKVDSHIFLGQAFQKKKMFDMADGQYQKAEEAGGGILGEKILYIWYYRACNLAESGQFPKALELGKKIMEEKIDYKDISARVDRWQLNQA
ncbi:MAG: tetratricopeptide repeat protein [Planctomycetes bacterium]|nr:tetratricopeptide repeat protein [Planctomycetota bacterium]